MEVAEKVGDSPLEGDGFEPLVPQREGIGLLGDLLRLEPLASLAKISTRLGVSPGGYTQL